MKSNKKKRKKVLNESISLFSNLDLSPTIVENTEKLEFSNEEAISFKNCVKRELSNIFFPLLIALTASYGYFMYLNYLKFSFFLLAVTIYLYNVYLTNESNKKINICSKLIQKNSEFQVSFFKRINASQLVKINSNEQIDERAKWLNDLIYKFWPYINCLIQKQVDRNGFTSNGVNIGYGHIIYFENFTLGDKPPVITSISVNTQGCRNDELVVDMKLLYSGNCLLSFSKKTLVFLQMNAGVKDIYFRCNARLSLRPLVNEAPYFGGYSFYLLEKPIVDYEGINFANLADNQLFKNYLVNQIASKIVIPNSINFNIFDEEEIIRKIKQPIPIGLCFLQIVEAENLPMMDVNNFFFSGVDPFCVMTIGRYKFETPVVYKSRNPYWFTSHSAAVHDLYDLIKIDIFDKDALKSDYIGSLEFVVKDIAEDSELNGTDKWLPISRSKTGSIHFRIAYFNITSEITKSFYSNLIDKSKKSVIKFPLGIFSLYIYDLSLDEFVDRNKLVPLIQIRFNGVTYQTPPIEQKISSRTYKVEECYHFSTFNPTQDLIEFAVLDVSSFNLTKLVNVDMLKKKILGSCAISLKSVLNKEILINQTRNVNENNMKKSQTSSLLNSNKKAGFIENIEIFTCHSEKNRREVIGKMKVFFCLSLSKLETNIYSNLQKKLHVKTNPDQLSSNTSFFKRIFNLPTYSIMYSLRTIQNLPTLELPQNAHFVFSDNVFTIPNHLNQNYCYAKIRFVWPERKRIFIEVLHVINFPNKYLIKRFKYSISVILKENSNLKINKKNNQSLQQKNTCLGLKRTSKMKFDFNSNAIVFNQRLAFKHNPQLPIEDYLMLIQLNSHSTKCCLNIRTNKLLTSAQIKLPLIIFRCDPVERWISFNN